MRADQLRLLSQADQTVMAGMLRTGFKAHAIVADVHLQHPVLLRQLQADRDLAGAGMTLATDPLPKGRSFSVQVAPDTVHKMKVFVTVAKDLLPASQQEFTFRVEYPLSGEIAEYTATFNVPESRK